MAIHSERIEFKGAGGDILAARLEWPAARPATYALFAHCFTCSKDVFAAARICNALAERGIAVLRFDFTGLGGSEGDFANTNFSSNVDDLVAAADFMRGNYQAPEILIGHSLGGAAVLAAAPRDGWQAMLIFSIGAGIYEELLFRLIGIAVLHMILVDVLVFNEKLGAVAAIALSAMAFALYHFSEDNPFTWSKCLFYSGAGVYFAAVYVLRGFGIVAGTHAVYDVIVVLLQVSQTQGEP